MAKVQPPNPELPKDVRRELHKAIKIQGAAKADKDDAERRIKGAKGTILPILAAFNAETYGLEGTGRVNRRVSRGSTINAGALKGAMVLEGIDPEAISRIIAEATRSWATEYIEFKSE